MNSKLITRDLLASSVSASVGLAFLYFGAVGEERLVLHSVLMKLGCALTAFAVAAHPAVLFERIERNGKKIQLPMFSGLASALNIGGMGCFLLAGLSWLAK